MASNPRLFTLTRWLVRAGIVVCALGAIVLGLCLGGLALVGSGLWAPHNMPPMLYGVTRGYVMQLVAMAMIAGLALLALASLILRAVDQIVGSAINGDPFIVENADRLSRIGWLLVGVFGVQFVMRAMMGVMVPASLKGHIEFGGFDFSPIGVLAILLIFVLAQIFRRGSEMRAELEGTV